MEKVESRLIACPYGIFGCKGDVTLRSGRISSRSETLCLTLLLASFINHGSKVKNLRFPRVYPLNKPKGTSIVVAMKGLRFTYRLKTYSNLKMWTGDGGLFKL